MKVRTTPLTLGPRRLAMLLSCLLLCHPGRAGTDPDDPAAAPKPQVVTITGHFSTDLRPYSWYLPGIREFAHYHGLAPQAALRFGLVSGLTKKPLPLAQARLEKHGFFSEWTQDLPVEEDGWFSIPESEEAERRNADVFISRRSGTSVTWLIDIQTPGLPAQVYRLGDLRLECRVYLAIEWAKWHGRRVMGQVAHADVAPMDAACSGPRGVFFNTRPWPRLQGFVLSENGRQVRYNLRNWPIDTASLSLSLFPGEGAAPWSDDARVEFLFAGVSHWQAVKDVAPAQ